MLLLMDGGNRWDEKMGRDLFFFHLLTLLEKWIFFSIHSKWEWELATERIIKIDCDNLEMKGKKEEETDGDNNLKGMEMKSRGGRSFSRQSLATYC